MGGCNHKYAEQAVMHSSRERTVRRRFAASLWLLTSSCCASLSSFICSWWSRYRIWSKVSSINLSTLHALASRAPGGGLLPCLLATQQAVRTHKATVTSGRKNPETVQQVMVVHEDAQLPSHFVDAPAVWP